jgi:geranylgeranyl diphosphate synthase type I
MRDVLDEWRPVVDDQLAELVPRVVDDDYLADAFGDPSYEYDREAIQSGLADPIWDLLDRGGKRWRAVLFLLLVDGLGEDPHEYLPYAAIPEILHNGTIIVDDVEDEADLRRGEPAIHHVYGADIALNAGNAMYFVPLEVIDRNPAGLPPERRLAAYEMLAYELNRTHLGQGMDIVWHNSDEVAMTEAEYLEMCACKTGCLGRIVARLAAIVTGQPESVEDHLAEYAEALSVAFQIGDDILDVEHTLDHAGDFGKAFGNDVREGKKTLMVLHAVRNAPDDRADRLTEILAADDNTDDEILEAIDALASTGSVEYARERALDLAATACDHMDAVGLDPGVAADLKDFTRFVVERDV